MGHIRLGTLPDTAPWRRVVALIAENADAAAVAEATTRAALRGLERAKGDEGIVYGVWLLSQVVSAAQGPDFAGALHQAGLSVPADPGVFDIIGSFSEAMDRRLLSAGGRTDIGEMAQLAAVESLAYLLGQRSGGLFGTTPVEVQQAARGLSTKQGFATLAHDFFARFAQRFLTYHLGRELSSHVGGNGRFARPEQHTEFIGQLEAHCREAAAIMRAFAGGWYSKAHFEGGITPAKARTFVNYALTKLGRELRTRGERDG
jgi:hypothetical protein